MSIEPIGFARGDVQAAIVASTVANCNRTKGHPLSPAVFVPKWLEERRRQTAKEMECMIKSYFNLQRGKKHGNYRKS